MPKDDEASPKRMYEMAQELLRAAKNGGYTPENEQEQEDKAIKKMVKNQNRADYASPKKKKISTAVRFLKEDK